MKRLTLEIDLKENEAFEKEIEEIIRAKARELARNEHSKLIEEEVSKEVKRLTEGNSWGYKDKLKSIVKELTIDEMKKTITDLYVENITKQCVKDRIEYIVSKTTCDVELKCKQTLENTINTSVQNKLNSILNC